MRSMDVKLFDGSPEDWDAFVGSHPEATFFHQYGWLQLVREVYGGRPYYLAAYDHRELVGVLPLMLRWVIGPGRIMVSVPFADEGGLLASSSDAEQALFGAAQALGRDEKVSYVELRQMRELLRPDVVCDTSRVVMRMPIPEGGADALWDSFSSDTRKTIRRAVRDGLETQHKGTDGLAAFHRVYSRNMRDLGSPMHRLRFFQALHDTFPGHVQVMLLALGDQVVGAAVAVAFRGALTVLCAHSLRAFRKLKPNNLLHWRLFESAVERGCSVADFGRSPRGSGAYEFKRQWGMEECQLYDSFLPLRGAPPSGERRESAAYKLFARVWRHTPVGIARKLGPYVFSRIPI